MLEALQNELGPGDSYELKVDMKSNKALVTVRVNASDGRKTLRGRGKSIREALMELSGELSGLI